MYKEKLKSYKQKISITIPKSYVNKELEISMLPVKPKLKNFNKFFGIMKYEISNENIQSLRNEWVRL